MAYPRSHNKYVVGPALDWLQARVSHGWFSRSRSYAQTRLVQKGAASVPGRGACSRACEAIVTEAKEQETFKQEGQLPQNEEWNPMSSRVGFRYLELQRLGESRFQGRTKHWSESIRRRWPSASFHVAHWWGCADGWDSWMEPQNFRDGQWDYLTFTNSAFYTRGNGDSELCSDMPFSPWTLHTAN